MKKGGSGVDKVPANPAGISDQEWQVIKLIRDLGYGELVITVKESKPIRVEEVRKSIPIR